MYRALIVLLLISAMVASEAGVVARGKEGHPDRQSLVNRVLAGAGWQLEVIPVINRSSYNRAAVEYSAQLWATTSAPGLAVRHESPMPCRYVKPVPHTIVLCDAEPWTGPSASSITGFTANYTQPKKRGKRVRNISIQASVIWLYQPRWTNEMILRYIPSHELGHALGLDEMDCECVMTPLVSAIDVLGRRKAPR